MKKIAFILLNLSLLINGCSFGEYADEDKKQLSNIKNDDGKEQIAFNSSYIDDKTLYKVSKNDKHWNMSEYDFNATNHTFKQNHILGDEIRQTGEYNITKLGYLRLKTTENITYIKPIKQDNDKIFIFITSQKSELDKTSLSYNSYFFTKKQKADDFIK